MKDWMEISALFNIKIGRFVLPMNDEQLNMLEEYISGKLEVFTTFMIEKTLDVLRNDAEVRSRYFGIPTDGNSYSFAEHFKTKEMHGAILDMLEITDDELPYTEFETIMEMNMPAYVYFRWVHQWAVDNKIAIDDGFRTYLLVNLDRINKICDGVTSKEIGKTMMKEFFEEAMAAKTKAMQLMFGQGSGDGNQPSSVNANTVAEILKQAKGGN